MRIKNRPQSVRANFIKPSNERGLLGVGASKPGDQSLKKHAHENREFEHGDECVVGKFVLAYP